VLFNFVDPISFYFLLQKTFIEIIKFIIFYKFSLFFYFSFFIIIIKKKSNEVNEVKDTLRLINKITNERLTLNKLIKHRNSIDA
jgi:hypothetical protein